jgi:hypothetical protein
MATLGAVKSASAGDKMEPLTMLVLFRDLLHAQRFAFLFLAGKVTVRNISGCAALRCQSDPIS